MVKDVAPVDQSHPFGVIIRRACSTPTESEILSRVLRADNEGYATATHDGVNLEITTHAHSLRELLRATDDLLSCLDTAQRSLVKASQSPAGNRNGRKPKP